MSSEHETDIVSESSEKPESVAAESVAAESVSHADLPEKNNSGEQKSVNVFAVAFRSAFWTVVAGVLLCACFLSFFPYQAMRFYAKLDLKEMALMHAEKYLSRHAGELDTESGKLPSGMGKYADALYYAANTSVYFMNKSADKNGCAHEDSLYYAAKADKYSTMYLDWYGADSLNKQDSLIARTQKIDQYNITHTAPRLRPHVYSYTDYLNVMRFKSWYVLTKSENEDTASLYADKMSDRLSTATTGWNETTEWQIRDDNESDVADIFLLFAQLSTYIDTELGELGLGDVISSSDNGLIRFGDIRERDMLSGLDKPFDLFLLDKAENSQGGEKSIFTGRYDDITYRFKEETFVDILKRLTVNGSKYIPGSQEENAANYQLQYTYYLKSLTDFMRSMNNMTAVFYANVKYFADDPEDIYDTDYPIVEMLRQSNADWSNFNTVYNVRNTENLVGCDIYFWYENGMLADYLNYFKAAA